MISLRKCSFWFGLWCVLLAALPFTGVAGQADYLYDEVGRLDRVINDDNRYLIYQYDSVGNLLAIGNGITSKTPPTIISISPDVLFIGSSVYATVTGTNLVSTGSVTSDNPEITIKVLRVIDTKVELKITVSSLALPGTATITVTTLYGSANVQVTLTNSKLTLSPDQVALATGSSENITASITPSINKALTIKLSNDNASVLSTPETVTIPASGTTVFSISALKEGAATITSGDSRSVVFVTKPFKFEDGDVVGAQSVSIYIDAPSNDVSFMSQLISARITPEIITDAVSVPRPVSIYIDTPTSSATATSSAASILIEPTQGNSSSAAGSVSICIDAASDGAVFIAQPVSIKISPL